jgi:hypothetical protein
MTEFIAYYKRPGVRMDDYYLPDEITETRFVCDWCPVMRVEAENMEDAWLQMQGEVWSPYGEAREAIKALGLAHTSMSIGDIFYNPEDGKYYWVAQFNFEEVFIRNWKPLHEQIFYLDRFNEV